VVLDIVGSCFQSIHLVLHLAIIAVFIFAFFFLNLVHCHILVLPLLNLNRQLIPKLAWLEIAHLDVQLAATFLVHISVLVLLGEPLLEGLTWSYLVEVGGFKFKFFKRVELIMELQAVVVNQLLTFHDEEYSACVLSLVKVIFGNKTWAEAFGHLLDKPVYFLLMNVVIVPHLFDVAHIKLDLADSHDDVTYVQLDSNGWWIDI
jgi:hypothetical protein